MNIKVCGLKYPENIAALTALNIDKMGFVFYPKSPRYVAHNFSKATLEQIPDTVQKVGIFVNPKEMFALEHVFNFGLDIVQLHGDESVEFCRSLSTLIPVIKAFRVGEDFDFEQTKAYEPYCRYFLFDTKGKKYGGNGIKFNWDILQNYEGNTPFLLSGGISPNDVAVLQEFYHPKLAGIDINSGFELAPGLKDVAEIQAFIRKLNSVSPKPKMRKIA